MKTATSASQKMFRLRLLITTRFVRVHVTAPHTALPVSFAARPSALIMPDAAAVCLRARAPGDLAHATQGPVVTNTIIVNIDVPTAVDDVRRGVLTC